MRVLMQRVTSAAVDVGGERVGEIGPGLLILLGIKKGDSETEVEKLVKKVAELRVFPDESGKMNVSVEDFGGEVLVVSQFTLYGETAKGRRPAFTAAARPEDALPLYESFVNRLRDRGLKVEEGRFGAMMQVHSTNDGPVTFILDAD